jgi:hypothetical protein
MDTVVEVNDVSKKSRPFPTDSEGSTRKFPYMGIFTTSCPELALTPPAICTVVSVAVTVDEIVAAKLVALL